MNYLAHALLSFDDPELLTGNLIADFVKGTKRLELFPEKVKTGILIHRKIDAFSDKHPVVLRAKHIFRPQYRLYSGAFIDVLFDHFLANDPFYFSSETVLKAFTEKVYEQIGTYSSYFPAAFERQFPYMTSENWLLNYRSFKGLKQGYAGIARRAKYLSEWQKAFELTVRHYYELNQLYFEYFGDVVAYVKKELMIGHATPSR